LLPFYIAYVLLCIILLLNFRDLILSILSIADGRLEEISDNLGLVFVAATLSVIWKS
jgi:hypothetical protein